MTKIRYLAIGLVIMVTILFFLWPLSSSTFEISVDEEAAARKAEFLSAQNLRNTDPGPNIVVIVVDDLGLGDLSLYGNGYPPTPNIDRVGAEGVVFENAYVTSPVCSPSRAAMLTGRYQQRFGFQYQIHERYLRNRLEYYVFKYFLDSHPWMPKLLGAVPSKPAIRKQGIPPTEITLPELLNARGYETALIGKWHLGADSLRNPCRFGFDYQFGFLASHSLYAPENSEGIHDQKIDSDFTDAHIWRGQRKGAHAIYENCREITVEEYLTDRFADEAIRFVREKRSHPFFLFLSFNAPHTPLQAPLSDMENFSHIDDPIKRTYYAMISNLDRNLGRIFNSLEEASPDNTLIFFISDNGGAEYTFTTDNGNYKGGKITDLEGGVKVPFFISWNNRLNAGRYRNMVSSMDIFQTIAEVVGVDLPGDRRYDGVNLIPYMSGENSGHPHDYLFWQRGFSKAIRDNRWKLCINADAGDTLLFDLIHDPYESSDLFKENPIQGRKLAGIHRQWSESLPPPLWPSLVNYVFADGEKIYYFDQ